MMHLIQAATQECMYLTPRKDTCVVNTYMTLSICACCFIRPTLHLKRCWRSHTDMQRLTVLSTRLQLMISMVAERYCHDWHSGMTCLCFHGTSANLQPSFEPCGNQIKVCYHEPRICLFLLGYSQHTFAFLTRLSTCSHAVGLMA
jgi:hypothetical protein